MKLKYFIVLVIGYIIGFYTNVLLMYEPPQVLLKYKNVQDSVEKTQSAFTRKDTSEITVNFDGKQFIPDHVEGKVGKRIEIFNKSTDKLMQLMSDTEELNTTRGYGESERFRAVIMNPGEYTVIVKDVPSAKLVVTVETYEE